MANVVTTDKASGTTGLQKSQQLTIHNINHQGCGRRLSEQSALCPSLQAQSSPLALLRKTGRAVCFSKPRAGVEHHGEIDPPSARGQVSEQEDAEAVTGR